MLLHSYIRLAARKISVAGLTVALSQLTKTVPDLPVNAVRANPEPSTSFLSILFGRICK
jgi:hypothetical protein